MKQGKGKKVSKFFNNPFSVLAPAKAQMYCPIKDSIGEGKLDLPEAEKVTKELALLFNISNLNKGV